MSKPKPKLKSKPAAATATSPKASGGKSIVESAQHIWLAGLGAFAKAQDEGTRLFEALVREGVSLEQKTRKLTTGKAEEARVAMEAAVGQVKERSQETWDKLEKVFEDRVQKALVKLGVPGRDDLNALTDRVERLTAELRKSGAKAPAAAPARKAARKAAAKSPAKTARKAPAARKASKSPRKATKAAADNTATPPAAAD